MNIISTRQSKIIKTCYQRLWFYWNEYKTKSDKKNSTNEFRYFFESNFFGVNRLFVLIYTNQGNNDKRFNAQKYIT